ncbi:hypothetical protein JR314_31075, partial [Pseudomonas aeruginosa]|uniref:hypothetical protein n=1 Tax=Pseudomonas aeruginosa TaxID=287 RepID=UPI0022EA690A
GAAPYRKGQVLHSVFAAADRWQNKFSPTVHRIDEVLSAIQDADPGSAGTINRVRIEVECGELDDFWAIHFDTFVTLGAVS